MVTEVAELLQCRVEGQRDRDTKFPPELFLKPSVGFRATGAV